VIGAALSLLLVLPSALRFAVDYAAFRSAEPDSAAVEIYHGIPYDQLHYKTLGDTIYAEYQVTLRLADVSTGSATTQSIYEPAIIPSYAEAQRRQLTIAHSFSVNLVPGRYLMDFEVRETLDQGTVQETLVVRDLRRAPSLSDPILGVKVVQMPTGSNSVVPLPSRTFGRPGFREMYVYVDCYDLAGSAPAGRKTGTPPEAGSVPIFYHELSISVLDTLGKLVESLPSERRGRSSSRVSEIFGLSVQGLKPGRYRLQVGVRDLATDSVAFTGKDFYVEGPGVRAPIARVREKGGVDTLTLTSDQRKSYSDLRYIATERELKDYGRLGPAGKAEFLRRFWQGHDFATYQARLQVVDERFRWGLKPGRDMDEGRIYLRYGEPDEIEVHTMIEHALPHEHWHYYRLGYHFIFVDVRSDGRLRLVYSNTDLERKDPDWERLVDPLELDDLQR
jgi:GWxTD domain-containing protein